MRRKTITVDLIFQTSGVAEGYRVRAGRDSCHVKLLALLGCIIGRQDVGRPGPDLRGAQGARAPGLPPTGGLPPNSSYFFVRDMCLAFLIFRLLQSPT